MVTISQMKFRKLAIMTAILISATGLATASQAELTVFPEESSTRIDSFTSYEVSVENVGPVEDTYKFTSSSVKEIDVAPRKVNLEPGEEETINVWYNPSQDREEGTYSFSVTAESRATGQRYSEQFLATVIRDHDVTLDISETSQTACRGETATYELEITNDGIQKEEFQVTTDYGVVSRNSVTLEDGETQTVTLTASSETETTENFNVRVASKTSYAQDIRNIQFNAENCYESEVSVTPEQQRVPGGSTAVYDVNLRNLGTRTDTFTLSASQGSFTANNLEIEGGEARNVQLRVPTEELGTREVTVESEGLSSSSDTVSLETYNGNNMAVRFVNAQKTACETEDEATVRTVIENTGEVEETYTLETSRGELEREEVTVAPGETATVNTFVDATELETGTYEVRTTVTAASYGRPVKSSTAQLTVENCWDVSINVVPEIASAGENRSVIYEINVENTGILENTYELEYSGPEWVSIKPETLTVEPGDTGKAYMYAGIPFRKEGNVQITATAVGTNAEASQTVELVVGQEIEEAIRDDADRTGGLTGSFARLPDFSSTSTLYNIAAAVLVAAILTAAIIYREW